MSDVLILRRRRPRLLAPLLRNPPSLTAAVVVSVIVGMIAVLCMFVVAPAAHADTGATDVTSDLRTALETVISAAILALVYFARDWAKTHTAGQSEALDWSALTTWLDAQAHSAVFDHLLTNQSVTLDTKSELGNQLVAKARTAIVTEVKRLGLTDQTLAGYAEAAVAKALNMMPTAPPYLEPPAPRAAATGAAA